MARTWTSAAGRVLAAVEVDQSARPGARTLPFRSQRWEPGGGGWCHAGCPARKFQCALQAEMWLWRVSSCSVSGPVTCPASLPPTLGRRCQAAFWAERAPAFLVGCSRFPARPLPRLSACAAVFGPHCLVFLFSSRTKTGDWSNFVSQTPQPKWIKALCRRGEPAKKEILNKTKPGVWAFPAFPCSELTWRRLSV